MSDTSSAQSPARLPDSQAVGVKPRTGRFAQSRSGRGGLTHAGRGPLLRGLLLRGPLLRGLALRGPLLRGLVLRGSILRGLFPRGLLLLALLAGAWLVAQGMRERQLAVTSLESLRGMLDDEGRPRPQADVARIARTLKIVTVELDADVHAESESRSWRGVTQAHVAAPARYLFGVDLSELSENAIHNGPLGGMRLTVPKPELLAVEIDSGAITEDVQVSGLRFRSLSGQTQLRVAQKSLHDEARRQAFAPDVLTDVRARTRSQIEYLLSRLLGSMGVQVRFEDES